MSDRGELIPNGGRKEMAVVLAIMAGVIVAYLSPLIFTYGNSDDFNFLADAKSGVMRLDQNPFVEGGRPVLALLMVPGFAACRDLGDLSVLRGIGLAGTLVFLVILYRWARRMDWSVSAAAALASLSVLNIGWAVYVGWTACFSYPFASALAFQSGVMTWQAMNPSSTRRRAILLVGAAGCMAVVFCIYQPSAGFVLLPALIAMLRGRGHSPVALAAPFGLYVAISAAYFVGYVLAKHVFGWTGEGAARSAIGFDLQTKLVYLGHDILIPLFRGWGELLPGLGSWLYFAVTLVLLGTFFLGPRTGRNRGMEFAVGAAAMGFAVIPMIMPATPYAPFRTLAAPFAILTVFCVAGVERCLPKGRSLAFGALIALVVAHCAFWTWNGMVAPRAAEWRILRNLVATEFPRPPSFFIFRPPEISNPNSYTSAVQRHEYGSLDSSKTWIPEALVNVIAADLLVAKGQPATARDWKRIGVAMTTPATPGETAGYPLIDANAALQGLPKENWSYRNSSATVIDPRVGPFVKLLNWNWCFSPALGYFRSWDLTNGHPVKVIEHPRFGSLKFASKNGNGIVFRNDEGNAVVFSEKLYPEAVVRERDSKTNVRTSLKGPFDLP